ncbi:MAG: hypothetical protein U0354_17690 [Candidatus Sericytochromatia bacterium]
MYNKPLILKKSEDERFKKQSTFISNKSSFSIWQSSDNFLNEKGFVVAMGYAMLNIFGFINGTDGIFISNNLNSFNSTNTQINSFGQYNQNNYSFTHFSYDEEEDYKVTYIPIVWQSENQDGDDFGIFANVFVFYSDSEEFSYLW